MSKGQFYFLLALLFALLVAVFAIQNPESITINFLVWRFEEVSKVLVILASTAIGALVVIFLGSWWQFKKFVYIRKLEGEVKELQSSLAKLSNRETKPEKMEEKRTINDQDG